MPNRPTDTLAERLKIAFDDSGLSVNRIAAACDISVQSVYKWLNGSSADMDGKHLMRVALMTQHDPLWLEFGMEPKIRAYATSQRQATVLQAMEQLSDTQSAALEQIATSLVKMSPGTDTPPS